MKFTIYSLLLLLLLTSCYEQERNCSDYRTGKFEFTQEIDGKKQTTIFERNDTLQIETYNGKTDTASVRWINDCEFILQKTHPKSMSEKKAISMRILTTTKNGYLFEFGFVNNDKKQRGTVTKIQ